jgi:hypothetical protein
MVSFSSPESIRDLRSKLVAINRGLGDIEIEEVFLYGDVEDRLKKANLKYSGFLCSF